MPPSPPPGLPLPHSSVPSAEVATQTRPRTTERDEELLRSIVALALRPPPAVVLSSHDMNVQKPYLTSGHSSSTSVSSINSTTPIYKDAPWSKPNLETASVGSSSEDNLSQAIADDIAALEPVERGYHRQTTFWLFSMIWAHQIWWIVAALSNLPFVLHTIRLEASTNRTTYVAQAALVNLTITVLVRNELILTALYWGSNLVPVRRFYAHRMVHSIGGLHVGCGIGAFLWITFYAYSIFTEQTPSSALHIALLVSAFLLPLGTFLIILFALRPLRDRFHNVWEYTHRFLGWFVLFDLVAHLALVAASSSTAVNLLKTSLPYLTALCIISVFYVWFTVRRPNVTIQANKHVAVVTFPGKPTMASGTFARISRDGIQWHAFSVALSNSHSTSDAEAQKKEAKAEFSLIVARAGDWTTKLIGDALQGKGPERMFIRGVHPPGFMYMHHAYKKVITVCTGAGIAPALPHIEQRTSDILLIWIAKNHRKTYGETVWQAVSSNLPSSQIILHDTGKMGRPDIGSLIERAAKMHDAEAVFVVSNDAYTQLCANICWRKGLRCYGATRDS
ncbi:hypothetical protein BDV93DRAFT_546855 [Ceratobasidium sp. AG-I]|nr:hypothetical protein BDV93DRAFT_546855 [Ceratobasidium sp. AG-I]